MEFPCKKYPSQFSLDENDYVHEKKKYYTNMYTLSKWSKFIRGIYKNGTLDKFCNKMSKDTYIMGVPASSAAIGHVLVALNMDDDEIVNPGQGSVEWVQFNNVIDAMDIANYLQISDILVQCEKVIKKTLPAEWSTNSQDDNNFFNFSGGYSGYRTGRNGNVELNTAIKIAKDINSKPMALSHGRRYLLMLINYLQNRSFDWYNDHQRTFPNKKVIERSLLAFMLIANKYLNHAKKLELFTKYVKPGDHAYTLYFQITFTAFGKRYDSLYHKTGN